MTPLVIFGSLPVSPVSALCLVRAGATMATPLLATAARPTADFTCALPHALHTHTVLPRLGQTGVLSDPRHSAQSWSLPVLQGPSPALLRIVPCSPRCLLFPTWHPHVSSTRTQASHCLSTGGPLYRQRCCQVQETLMWPCKAPSCPRPCLAYGPAWPRRPRCPRECCLQPLPVRTMSPPPRTTRAALGTRDVVALRPCPLAWLGTVCFAAPVHVPWYWSLPGATQRTVPGLRHGHPPMALPPFPIP